MTVSQGSARLVELLGEASDALIGVLEGVSAERWGEVARPGEWSLGKDAEHVTEGNALHQWVVRSALRLGAGKRPPVERARMTALLAQAEVIGLLRQRTLESSGLIASLTDEQLRVPCRTRTVGEFIERVLIGHFGTHRGEIERKVRRAT